MRTSHLLLCLFLASNLNSQPTTFNEYLRDYYESDDFTPSGDGEDGMNEQVQRIAKVWQERLYPNGSIAKAAVGLNSYVEEFFSTEGIPAISADWRYLGPYADQSGTLDAGWSGRINRILFDPGYGLSNWRIYACTAHGGLWVSNDRGYHWAVANTDNQIPITSAADVAVSFQNSNHIILATGEPDQTLPGSLNPNTEAINPIFTTGVYRSLDGGQNWEPANGNFLSYFSLGGTIRRVVINPSNENNVFVGTSRGLFVTDNFMASSNQIAWSKIDEQNIRGLEFKPGELNKLYISGANSIYLLSIDNDGYDNEDIEILAAHGNSSPLNLDDLTGFQTTSINIATVSTRPDRLYAYIIGTNTEYTVTDCDNGTEGNQTTTYSLPKGYVYAFENGIWLELFEYYPDYSGCDPPSPRYLVSPTWNAITVDPSNPDRFFFGYTHVLGSYDPEPLVDNIALNAGVLHYGRYTNYIDQNSHADHHDLSFEPYITGVIDAPQLFDGNDGGISVYPAQDGTACEVPLFDIFDSTTDPAFTNCWERRTSGLEISTLWCFDDSEKDKDMLLIGLHDNGTYAFQPQFLNGWNGVNVGDGFGAQVDDFFNRYYTQSSSSGIDGHNVGQLGRTEETVNRNCGIEFINQMYLEPTPRDSPGNEYCKTSAAQTFKIRHHPQTGEPYFGFAEIYRRKQATPILVGPPEYTDPVTNPDPTYLWEQRSDIQQANLNELQWKQWRLITEFEISESDPNFVYVVTRGFNPNGASWDLSLEFTKPHLLKCTSFDQFNEADDWDDTNFLDLTQNLIDEITTGMQYFEFDTENGTVYLPPLMTGLAMDPANPNRLWLSFTGYEPSVKVWRSDDGGINWVNEDPNGSLMNLPCNGIVYQEGIPNRLFLATDAGVWYKDDYMTDWVKYGDIPNVRVTELKINRCANKLRAATFGRGLWETDLPATHFSNDIPINSNTTWNEEKYFTSNIRVVPGVTLTINEDVYMPANGAIIVEPGAKLILNNATITNRCDKFWRGIEVQGLAMYGPNEALQGIVECNNGAVIENAIVGIDAQKTNLSTGEYVPWSTHGKVHCTGTTFRNCKTAVRIGPFNGEVGWAYLEPWNTINDCDFVTDAPLYEEQNPREFIRLEDCQATEIRGCDFRNEAYASYEPLHRGRGVYSNTAQWKMLDRCIDLNIQIPGCEGFDNNTFENLSYGIVARTANVAYPFILNGATFTNCLRGIDMRGVYGASITECTFNIPPNHVDLGFLYGIYLDRCAQFEIEENYFLNDGAEPGFKNVGVAIRQTKGTNRLYNNNFEGLATGTLVMKRNASADFETGLQLKCNDYGQLSQECEYDIALTGTNPSIAEQQGTFGEAPDDPAGNLFSYYPNQTESDFYIDQTGNDVTYNHHQPEINYNLVASDATPNRVTNQDTDADYDPESSCPTEISIEEDDPSHFVIKMAEVVGMLDTEWDVYNGVKDQGSTAELIATVRNANLTSQEKRNELLFSSPYVSQDVFRVIFTEQLATFNPWHVAQVCIANSPLKSTVLNMMRTSGIDQFYIDLIDGAQSGGLSSMSIMEGEIIGLTNEAQNTADDYWRHLISGTPGFSENTALGQLDEGNATTANQTEIAWLTNKGQYAQANALLGSCVLGGTADSFCEVQKVVLDAAENQINLADIEANIFDELELIAIDEEREGSAQALAILELARDTWQDEIILFPDGTRSLHLLPKVTTTKQHMLGVYPNPSHGNLFVTYKVHEGVDNVNIAVFDIQGNEILNESREALSGIMELKLGARASGIYKVILYWDNIKVDENSIEVLH